MERAASATALGVAVPALDRALDGDNPGERALRAHVVLRSRFAEERLEAAVRRGVQQCVVLGAGFDTFAYRQPAWALGLRDREGVVLYRRVRRRASSSHSRSRRQSRSPSRRSSASARSA